MIETAIVCLAAALVVKGGTVCDVEFGTNISQQQHTLPVVFGKAIGQTFVVQDTLLASISVWRWQLAIQGPQPLRIWVTGTDSLGIPDLRDILLQGPVIHVPGDTVTRAPVEMRWNFDPPLALPGPGKYALFAQDPCGIPIDIYMNETDNIYPEGELWFTSRSDLSGCVLRSLFSDGIPDADMIFRVRLCPTRTTPVRRRTWGTLKTIYR